MNDQAIKSEETVNESVFEQEKDSGADEVKSAEEHLDAHPELRKQIEQLGGKKVQNLVVKAQREALLKPYQAIPQQMQRDTALIKDLTVDGGRFFLESRPVPYPTPDVGRPEWQLKRCPGEYSLRVALFFDEPGFRNRVTRFPEGRQATTARGR